MPFGIGGTSVADIVGAVRIDGIDKAMADFSKLGQGANSAAKQAEMGNRAMTVAVAAAGAALTAAVLAAGSYEEEMAKLHTVLNVTDEQFASLSAGLKELNQNTSLPLSQLSEGMRELSFAGAPVEQMLGLVDQAATAAEAGFTDVSTAIGGVSKIINAYKMDWSEFENIEDMMFAATKAGAGNFGALQSAMGTVVPMASQLKIPLDELLATVAAMSKIQGLDATTSGLKMLMAAMSGNEAKWEAQGIHVFDASGKFSGFASIIGELTKKFEGLSGEQLANIESQIGINKKMISTVSVLTTSYDSMRDAQDKIKNSAGDTAKAEALLHDTMKEQVELLGKKLTAAYAELGEAAVPVLKDMLDFMNQHPEALKNIVGGVSALAIGIGSLVVVWKTWSAVSAAWKGLKIADSFLNIKNIAAASPATFAGYALGLAAIYYEYKLISDAMNKYIDAERNRIKAQNDATQMTVQQNTAFRDMVEKLAELKELAPSTMVELSGKTMTAGDAVNRIQGLIDLTAKTGKVYATEISIAAQKTGELNTAVEESISKYEVCVEALKGVHAQLASENAKYNELEQSLRNANLPLVESVEYIENQTSKVKESNVSWTDYSQLIRTITADMGPVGAAINIMTDAWGSAYEKTKTVDMSLVSILRNMDLVSVSTSVLKIGMDAWNEANEKTVITMQVTDKSIEEMRAAIIRMKEGGISPVEEALIGMTERLIEQKMAEQNATAATSALALEEERLAAKLAYIDPITQALTSHGIELTSSLLYEKNELERLMQQVGIGTYEYQQLSDKLKDVNEKLGLTTQAEIVMTEEMRTGVTPAMEAAWRAAETWQNALVNAHDANVHLNAAMQGLGEYGIVTTAALNQQRADLELLLTTVGIGSLEYGQLTDKLGDVYEKLGLVNPYIKEEAEFLTACGISLKTFKDLGIETTEQVWDQITALEVLLPNLTTGSYEYQQVIDKLGPLYTKLGEINPYIEQQTADVIGLMASWINFTDSISSKFGTFNSDVAALKNQLDNIAYYKLDINTEGYQEKIGTAIWTMMEYLRTLDPTSQAWIDANKTLGDLATKFIDLGGDISNIKPTMDISSITSGAANAESTVSTAKTNIEANTISLKSSIQPIINDEYAIFQTWMATKARIEQESARVNIDIGGAMGAIYTLERELGELCDTNWSTMVTVQYQHLGGVLHGGGLVMHGGGALFGEGAELLRAHAGMSLGTGGREEVPFIGLKGEYVMRNAFVEKYGVEKMDFANKTLDGGVFEGGQQLPQVEVLVEPRFVVRNAGPLANIEFIDRTVQVRLKETEKYTKTSGFFQ